MSEQSRSTITVEERQKLIGLWAAGIFTVLGLIFFAYSIYIVVALQQGRMDLSDKILMPVTALMVVASIISYGLIRRSRHAFGTGLLFFIGTLVLPVVTVLLLKGLIYVAILYIVSLATIMIRSVLPNSIRRTAWIATSVTVLLTFGIEYWNPSFRLGTGIGNFTTVVTVLAIVGLLTYFVRQAWSGNIRLKLVTSFTVIALISVAVIGTVVYISYRNQVRQDIRQRLLNIISITALQQDGDLHATLRTREDMQTDTYKKMEAVNASILATDRDLAYIWTARTNEQGQIIFVLDNSLEKDYEPVETGLIYKDPSDLLAKNVATLDHPIVEEDFYTDIYGTFLSAYAPIYKKDGTKDGFVGVDIFADKILAKERLVLFQMLGTTLATMIIVTLIGLWLGNLFVGPVINLSHITKKITGGDLGARAKIETADEIGELAKDFNIMTSQLQETLQGLEQRVAVRTRNLELAAEVGRAVSQVRALDVMLKDASELILKEFNLYYVQVYLTNASGSTLKLEAGTGSVGTQLVERGHSLSLNTNSINGRAAVEKHPMVISDTTKSATFRKNPLLPETQGEMAMPLMVADKVVGVLDMQSSQPGVLTDEMLPAFEALAGQLAVAIQNANLLAETEQARAQVEAQARRLVRQGWSEHLDAIHQPEQLGFVFDHNKVTPLSEMDEAQLPENGHVISAPIAVTGESLGSLVVEINDEARREQTNELVNIVAHQVAQQIENLRLLDSAERYRTEAEEASRRLTHEGWKTYAEQTDKSHSYVYDLNEVRPQNSNGDQEAATKGYTLPLKVHDEAIGKLVIQGLDDGDTESVSLANTVAERLSTHIESLRLFEQTQVSLAETQTLYRINEAISGQTELNAIYQTVARLSCDELGFSGSWIAAYEPHNETLRGVAGINMPQERIFASLPISQNTPATLAAQKRQVVTINHPQRDERMTDIPLDVLVTMGKALSTPVTIGQELLGVIAVTRPESAADIGGREERMLQAVAIQLAIVMQRIKLFEQVQKQAKRESMLNTINQKIQSATSVEAVLQIAARELGHALGAPMTIAQLSMKDKSS